MMKLGYVTRVPPRDHFKHLILAVVGYKPKVFAGQINLNTANMWGIVKSIVDLCVKLFIFELAILLKFMKMMK